MMPDSLNPLSHSHPLNSALYLVLGSNLDLIHTMKVPYPLCYSSTTLANRLTAEVMNLCTKSQASVSCLYLKNPLGTLSLLKIKNWPSFPGTDMLKKRLWKLKLTERAQPALPPIPNTPHDRQILF